MKPAPPLRIDIFPCGYVTKLERIDCLFFSACAKCLCNFHTVDMSVLIPERDRRPCS